MRNSIFKLIVALVLVFSATNVFAESVVVVHPSNTSIFSQKIISDIFLGKAKKYSNGHKAKPIALHQKTNAQRSFNKNVLHKTAAQINTYWSKRIFTGKGRPPKVFETSDEIKRQITNNPNVIGIMDSSAVDNSVKVIHRF